MNLPSLILASKSPRRKQILTDAGFDVNVITKDIEENYPSDIDLNTIASFLSEKKARAFNSGSGNEYKKKMVITADTIVLVDGRVLGKPVDHQEAVDMIQSLSNTKHEVITGVSILYQGLLTTFSDTTEVYFRKLNNEEIDYYIETYKPFDKAGAYGIQEWIGMVGITKIVGSYYNVMGLPIEKVYENIMKLTKQSH